MFSEAEIQIHAIAFPTQCLPDSDIDLFICAFYFP
jgi:hypothetical protein